MLPLKLLEVGAFVFSRTGKIIAAGLVVVGLVVGFAREQRQIGASKVKAQQEKANVAAKQKVDAAAARSREPGAGGLRDPYHRAD